MLSLLDAMLSLTLNQVFVSMNFKVTSFKLPNEKQKDPKSVLYRFVAAGQVTSDHKRAIQVQPQSYEFGIVAG